jgi:hypothetical protein
MIVEIIKSMAVVKERIIFPEEFAGSCRGWSDPAGL